MANICDQRIVIAAETKDDMAKAIKEMAFNVVNGPNGEEYFTKEDIENATGDADALYELIKRTQGTMNLLCLFAAEPDSRTESGWMGWRIDTVAGHPVIEIDIGVKWSESFDPDKFCSSLDSNHFGYSISAGGEAYEWMELSIDDDYFEASEIAEKVAKSQKAKDKAKSLNKIAYHVNLSGIDPSIYEYDEADW